MPEPLPQEIIDEHVRRAHQASQQLREAAQWALIQQSFPYFLFEFVKTRDEHDPTAYAKPIPQKDYIKVVAQALQMVHWLAIPKSRQMLVSWVCCAFILWVALLRSSALCFIQSKKEEDADSLLKRVHDIYLRLPLWIRRANPINPTKDGEPIYCHMYFPWTRERLEREAQATGIEPLYGLAGSERTHIWAIPQGADVVRQYTATLMFSDESAFQEQAGDAYKAAAPTVDDNSWFIQVSSANPGFFEALVNNQKLDDAA